MKNLVSTAPPINLLPPQEELDWIQVRQELPDFHAETPKEKMARKLKENPLVPVGCAATLMALGFGLWNFRRGRSTMSQYMMRARILAQGFTVVALIMGAGVTYTNKQAAKK
ncbi:HIG1 domain family member 2A, mitochondrial [Anopheles cruzii]|uniref:HIG1 domain family member 2A, mitochondrial n=1 Tax=Anopheles cruzii TaxID=68878 RepID=UPI0022EC5E25|nr:HIG1 domain family member 2A, mitochondrial [Anopheles cruzii]